MPDTVTATSPIALQLRRDLLDRAQSAGLDLASLTEAAIIGALRKADRERFTREIAQACAAHENYLAEYGSFGEALRQLTDLDD